MSGTFQQDLESHLARFGLSSFRPGQKEVISAILAGRDCLCIMPTGGGKSLCYQFPAVVREGVTLVISPLIALMKDQVDALESLQVRATFVNSSLPPDQQRQRLRAVAAGQFDLVYVAPERLRNPSFLEAVRATRVQLLAVDEAHCISEWGHDFRPDYARLGLFRQRLGYPQTIALTATATPEVRQDVIRQLRLRSAGIFITGFARPNLRFEVYAPASSRDKNELLLEILQEAPGGGIVYASTRKRCEEVAELLADQLRRKVGVYHAGMPAEERRQAQESFMRGDVEIIVATNAFGMGIDKRDLRFVLHYNMPGSLEAYYQEAGRAGRDGQPSRCTLLFSYADRFIQEFFIENAYPSRDAVARVYEYLRHVDQDPIEFTQQELKERLDLPVGSEGVGACEQLLEKAGALERLDSQQNMAAVKLASELPTLVDLLPKDAKVQRKVLRALEREVDDRRFEWVYFHPQKIAALSQIDREAFQRALRELLKLRDFDYVPPFRGRAIHMLKRDVPFDALNIDFDELDRRKAAELEKLDRVIRYAGTRRCRQLEILDYFGDTRRSECGSCDNCSSQQPLARQLALDPSQIDEPLLEAIRMVLSGAARTQGRIGKHLLAKMLCGSKAAQVVKLKLDRLSTFGLLKNLKHSEAIELIDALIQIQLVEQIELDRNRPVVQLTDDGARVMRGQALIDTALPVTASLLENLRRRHISEDKRAAPPATSQVAGPTQKPSLGAAYDAGPPDRTPASAPREPETIQRADASVDRRPNHYWTWRLLADDYTLDECARIRRVDEETILDHLLRAAEDGLAVRPEWFLSAEQLAMLERIVGTDPPQRLRPVLAKLSPDIRFEHVQLYMKCRSQDRARRGSPTPPAP